MLRTLRDQNEMGRERIPLVVAVISIFGPPDLESTHSDQSTRWKIKLVSNDACRQKFVDQTAPQADYLGLKLPDPQLQWDADRGHYDFGPIDWEEFRNVIQGNGPCNRDRLRNRIEAHEQGAWVRDAAMAYAAKRAQRREAASHE